jgi:hypothetical protein
LSKHSKVHAASVGVAASNVIGDPSPSIDDLVRDDDNDLLLSDAILPGSDHLDQF